MYKAANISDSLYDLQMFITDLIKTVESAEANVAAATMDPQKTVTMFMELVQRHEGAFYHFVHSVHSKGEDLFDGLMHWIELFLSFIRNGLNPQGVTLDFLLPHAGKEREEIMKEIDSIIEYHRTLKIAHHERLRRRLMKGEVSAAASYTTGSGVVGSPGQVGFGPADKQQDAMFVEGVLQNLSMSGVADDIDDLNAEVDEDSDDDAVNDSFVSAGEAPAPQMANLSVSGSPPVSSHQTTQVVYLPPIAGGQAKAGKKQAATKMPEPELVHIPKLIPVFTEMLRPSLETAQRVQQLKAQQGQAKSSKQTLAAQNALRK